MNYEEFFELYQHDFKNLTPIRRESIERVLNAVPPNTPIPHIAYILATAYHETGGSFVPIMENMNYTTAKRLMQVWPSRFPSYEFAAQYIYNPVKLGNYVYNGRLGNKMGTDDGYNYRGRGLSQLTGKENYEKWGKILGKDFITSPELMCDPEVSAAILVTGLITGEYSGKKLSDYLNSEKKDYVNARRCVNADVKLNGQRIADIAQRFETILKEST